MHASKVGINLILAGRSLLMLDYSGPRFDQATRDYHHALRRIQCRRASSIANCTIVPWLIAAVVNLGAGLAFGRFFGGKEWRRD
jgi:hypothetical protein